MSAQLAQKLIFMHLLAQNSRTNGCVIHVHTKIRFIPRIAVKKKLLNTIENELNGKRLEPDYCASDTDDNVAVAAAAAVSSCMYVEQTFQLLLLCELIFHCQMSKHHVDTQL